jgi:hypothetical protein
MARWAWYQSWSHPVWAKCGIRHLKAICTVLYSGGLGIVEQPALVGHDTAGYLNLDTVGGMVSVAVDGSLEVVRIVYAMGEVGHNSSS